MHQMSSIPGIEPDQITHEEIDYETFSIEEFDESLPCDVPHRYCKSRHSQPATWISSHTGGESSCTVLMCEPCVVNLQQWIARCCVENGLNGFSCKLCGRSWMNYKEIITRHL